MQSRSISRWPFVASLLLSLPQISGVGAEAPPTQDFRELASEEIWQNVIRPGNFAGREIIEGAGQNIVHLKAPHRAEDAAVVPISIHAALPQTPERFIRRIHVYIDKNPVPLAGIFEFTPDSGRADLALRIRVDDFSYVRAIAEMNSGELYMDRSFVRATGACSAPPPKSIDDSIANMGTMKMRIIGNVEFEQPNLVQLMIMHPNITGLQPMRIGSRVRPPPHFVRDLQISYEGMVVMRAQLTFSISMDPSIRFFFVPHAEGTMNIEATDTQENHWLLSHRIGRS
jgi:sulfur-oxidizing protein SoxY